MYRIHYRRNELLNKIYLLNVSVQVNEIPQIVSSRIDTHFFAVISIPRRYLEMPPLASSLGPVLHETEF